MEWQKIVLHNLCEVTSSKRIYASEYQSEGIPFYRGREISEKYNGDLDVSTELFITESKYNEIKEKFGVPQAGDLLLTSVGTLGNPYVVKEGEIFYFKDGNLTWFKNFKGLDSKYLFYWLVSPQGKGELKKCTIGSSQSAFTIVLLKDMQIALPSHPTQRRIADILSAYDDLIENNKRRIRILEQMAQAIYQEWFGKVDKESLPERWKTAKIEDYGDVITGKTPSKAMDTYWNSRDIPFIRTPDMHNQFYCIETTDYVSTEGANSQKNAFIPPNSLCVSCIGTVGIVTITPIRAQTNQQINSVVLNDPSDLEFLYFELLGLKETFQSYAAAGATMANLSKGKFMAVNVLYPPKELREKFHAIASPMFEQIKNLQYKNANLRQTRDLLLPRLVSGEVDV